MDSGEHSTSFYNTRCKFPNNFDDSVQAVFLSESWDECPNGKRLRKFYHNKEAPHVTLTGRFESGSDGRYGPDVARSRLVIYEIVSVQKGQK